MKAAELNSIRDRLAKAIDLGGHLNNEYRSLAGELSTQYFERFSSFRSTGLSILTRVFGKEHHHTCDFREHTDPSLGQPAALGVGILLAARDDIAAGWLQTVRTLVAADLFSDFLEMAEYLLAEGYKDPSAVIIGSTLEEHLRSLCKNRGIAVEQGTPSKPRKADTLSADLTKADAYNLLDQKQVTAWLDLRNKAAHGQYSEYTREQVQNMLDGVRNFIARVPQ